MADTGYSIDRRVELSRYIVLQEDECFREHVYFMGQKKRRSVDDTEAMTDWTENEDIIVNGTEHKKETQAQRFHEDYYDNGGRERINRLCDSYCGENSCRGMTESGGIVKNPRGVCPLFEDIEKLHEALGDGWCLE